MVGLLTFPLAVPASAEPAPTDSVIVATSESAPIQWRSAPIHPASDMDAPASTPPAGSTPEFNVGAGFGIGPEALVGQLELRALFGPTASDARTTLALRTAWADEDDDNIITFDESGGRFDTGFLDFNANVVGLSVGRRHFFNRSRLQALAVGVQAGFVRWSSGAGDAHYYPSLDGNLGFVTGPVYLEAQLNTVPGRAAWVGFGMGLRFGQW